MTRIKSFRILLAVGVIAALVAGLAVYHYYRTNAGPQNLEDVVLAAREKGLHWRSEWSESRITHRLILSARPLTPARLARLSSADITDPVWRGSVLVCPSTDVDPNLKVPGRTAVWGEVFLFGDPTMIDYLLAPSSRPRLFSRPSTLPRIETESRQLPVQPPIHDDRPFPVAIQE